MRGFGEFVEGLKRRGALRVFEDGSNGRYAGQAVDLMAGELEDGHGGEGAHGTAVLGDELKYGGVAGSATGTGYAAGENDGGGHAFDVPLEGAADGFVEVVDVEGEAAVGSFKGAEVEDVSVSAKLGEEVGVGLAGEVGSHDGHGSAIETEGTSCHALVLDGDERLDAGALDGKEEFQRRGGAGSKIEIGVGLAGDLAAGVQAEGAAFVISKRGGQEWGGVFRHFGLGTRNWP